MAKKISDLTATQLLTGDEIEIYRPSQSMSDLRAPVYVFDPVTDAGNYSAVAFTISGFNKHIFFTGAENQIAKFQAGLSVDPAAYGRLTAPPNSTLTLQRPDGGQINGGTADWVVPATGTVEWLVRASNTIEVVGSTTAELKLTGSLNLAGQTIIPGAPVLVSGARLYGAADSGKDFRVDGAGTQQIPANLLAGWRVTILNNTATPITIDGPGGTNVSLGPGEICEVKYWSPTTIKVVRGATVGIN